MLLLLDAKDIVGEIFGESSYLAPFLVLLLCGVGLPLPEEVTLIGSGILYYRGEVEFVPIVLVCSTAILLGDSIPYFLGRKFGMNALRLRWVARVLHPERFARLRTRFEEHGNWATFACRFFPGVRLPGYFIAGTMGMRFSRFILLDALGVLISVPLSIYLGKLFGGSMDTLRDRVHDVHLILAFVALSLVLTLVVRRRRIRPQAPLAPPEARDDDPAPPPGI
jgi:membrane protein DedA with SNARE-associated domain